MLMTDHEAAEYLGISVSMMRTYRRRKTGPNYVKLDRLVRYRKADLDAFAEEHLVKAGGKGEAA